MKNQYPLTGGLIAIVLALLYQFIVVYFNVVLPQNSFLFEFADFISNPYAFPFNAIAIFMIGAITGAIFGKIKSRKSFPPSNV